MLPPPRFSTARKFGHTQRARALAAEALRLENEVSNLVNEAYALTPEEIALMWQTAPPRMPIPGPACRRTGD